MGKPMTRVDTKTPVKEKRSARRWSALTLRAFIIGLLLIPLLVFWLEYTESIASGPDMAGMSLPMAVVFALLVLISLNLIVKRARPALALSQAELLYIYAMTSVAFWIGGLGMMQFLHPALVGFRYFATPANHWESWWHFIPTWAAPDPSVVADYYAGRSSVWPHLGGWAGAIAVWSTFLFVLLFCFYCVNTLMRRQWVEREKLIFPIVIIPLEITKNGGDLDDERLQTQSGLLSLAGRIGTALMWEIRFRRLSLTTQAITALALALLYGGKPNALAVPAASLDTGWRLLLDDQAQWQDDTLYLPDEVHLAQMPTNPPTGGWGALSAQAGIPVSLPSTVEEHYWGKPLSGVAASNSPSDVVNARGSYLGVSWWYRPFVAPILRLGEHLIFSFPGARLRAEVYVNGKLVGYDLIGETAFTADATNAIRPGGPNLLAVRITNPGGRLDWIDFLTMQWGKYKLPATHGFGGIDGGVRMDVRGPVTVSDLAVLNHPDPKTVTLQAEVTSSGPAYAGPVALSITRQGKAVWSKSVTAQVPAGGTVTVTKDVTVAESELWDYGHPALYEASAMLPTVTHSDRQTTFGFRWFTAQGIGTDATLRLNGRRFVPRSSISWGFWAPNGLFPDQAAADREVAAVRALGLTGLQNHRHMPKPIVLDTFDRAGLLRYCEPGSGVFAVADGQGEMPSTQGPVDTSGTGGEPPSFLGRYELAKVLAMIKADRSHPCVIIWSLQNEISPDLHNPRIFYVLNKMREADPSRIIMLKSGIGTKNQVWTLPYSSAWMHDDGTGFSGWWDQHSATASAGVYQDGMYKTPDDFLYHSNNAREIVTWGEMATGASPDDHAADIAWHKANGVGGYDLAAHQALLGSYNKFLDDYGFRAAFPTAESLFLEAGNKHYFSAARILENARITNANDYIVLSGWEFTSIEDHSGLTDSLRLLKGDPSPLKRASAPELLVVRPRHYVIAKGDSAVVDVHLINESNLHGPYRLTVHAALPGAVPYADTRTFSVNVTGGERFGQLLEDNIEFTPKVAGTLTVRVALTALAGQKPVLERTASLLVVDTQPAPLSGIVAVAGTAAGISGTLQQQFGLAALPWTPSAGKMNTILAVTAGGQGGWQSFGANLNISNTPDPGLYQQQLFGPAQTVQTFHALTPGQARVELFLAETYYDQPGQRLFDVALNGKTILKAVDIFKEAGGKGKALVKTLTVDVPQGDLTISIPNVEKDNATFAAIRVTDAGGQVIRVAFRAEPFKDKAGGVWNPLPLSTFDWSSFLPAALARVHDDGTRLVLLTSGGGDAADAAAALAKQNILTYSGEAGAPGPSWLGFWYFGRKHWLLDGLPSDCVLDWPYQIGSGNGLFLSGSNVQAVIGYGKNHDPKIGIGAAVVTYGRGQIVLLDLPGLERAFSAGDGSGFQPVTAKRIIYNALRQ